MNSIFYLGSTGLGENLQATPAMRFLAKRNNAIVIPVIRTPHHMMFAFELGKHGIQRALGCNFKYTHGTVIVPPRLVEWMRMEAAMNGGDPIVTSHIGIEFEEPENWIPAIEMGPWPGRKDVASNLYARFGGPESNDPETFRMAARFPGMESVGENPFEACLCAGSAESIRAFDINTLSKLTTALFEAGFKDVSVLLNHKQSATYTQRKAIPIDSRAMVFHDNFSVDSLIHTAAAIKRSGVVITPDSGTLNLAAALGKPIVTLRSREAVEDVLPPVHLQHTTVLHHEDPCCHRNCRGWGHAATEGYPRTLQCWDKSPAPCLDLTDDLVRRVVESAKATSLGFSRA